MSIQKCKLIDIPTTKTDSGTLSYLEDGQFFNIRRLYYLYNLVHDTIRGNHAYKNLNQVIIPISGSFDVILDDGKTKKNFHLSDPKQGLYIAEMIWRVVYNFSDNTVVLVAADCLYNASERIDDYEQFIKLVT